MPTQVIAKNYIIGPADIHKRAVGVTTPWTNLGATLDDCVMRIVSEWFVPDNISGVKGPVMGLDVLRRLNAEFEFTLPDITGNGLSDFIPGSRETDEVHNDTVGTPFSSTVAIASAAGDLTVNATAVTNLAVGDYIRIGSGVGVLVEYRQVTSISTLVVGFRDALLVSHAATEEMVETDGDYRTKFQSSLYSRMPDSAYNEWAMVMSNGVGYTELRLPRALANSDSAEITVGDNSLSGVRVMLSGRRDGDDLTTSPYDLYAPAN